MPFDPNALIATLGSAAVLTGLVLAAAKFLAPRAAAVGAELAHLTTHEIGALAQPLPDFAEQAIYAELKLLASHADAAEMTVERAASLVLGRIAPTFPQATLGAVVDIVGQFTHAFVAGLAEPPTTAALAAPSASVPAAT